MRAPGRVAFARRRRRGGRRLRRRGKRRRRVAAGPDDHGVEQRAPAGPHGGDEGDPRGLHAQDRHPDEARGGARRTGSPAWSRTPRRASCADVILSTSLSHSHAFAARGRFDAAAAQAVVERLGRRHVLPARAGARRPQRQRRRGAERRLGPAADLPARPLRACRPRRRRRPSRTSPRAAKRLDEPAHGRHRAGHGPRRRLHRRDVRARRPGVRLRARRPRGHRDDRRPASAWTRWSGTATSRATAALRRRAGRGVHARRVLRRAAPPWSSGRRSSSTASPACATTRCRHAPSARRNPAFLAENSGLVGPLVGPDGGSPSQFGSISTTAITVDADTQPAQKLAEFMMTEGYVRWLALSPQGKYPVRMGPEPGSQAYVEAWKGLESGVRAARPAQRLLLGRIAGVAGRGRPALRPLGLRPRLRGAGRRPGSRAADRRPSPR